MNKLLCLLMMLMTLLTGCNSKNVFVWTPGDVFGLGLVGLVILVVAFLFARAAILDFIDYLKRKFKKNV